MIKQNQRWLNLLNLLSDALLTFLSWFIACWIRYDWMDGTLSVDFGSKKFILILSEMHPDYLPAYDAVMKRTSGHRFNMFLMKKEILGAYCG